MFFLMLIKNNHFFIYIPILRLSSSPMIAASRCCSPSIRCEYVSRVGMLAECPRTRFKEDRSMYFIRETKVCLRL